MTTNYGTTSSRMERKKEDTRQRIIEVAAALFRQHGFEATTMEQVAVSADVAKGTLYNYFPIKEAILVGYIQRSFQQKNPQRLAGLKEYPDTRSRLAAILGDLMAGVLAQPEIFEKFLIYRVKCVMSLYKNENVKGGMEELASVIIHIGRENGEIRTDLPDGVLEEYFEFVFVEAAKQYYKNPEEFVLYETIDRSVDLFLQGAGTTG